MDKKKALRYKAKSKTAYMAGRMKEAEKYKALAHKYMED